MSHPLTALSNRLHELPALQLPGRANRIRRFQVGGPEDSADRRLELDTATLRMLLDIAEQSEAGICVVPQVGLDVSLWEDARGHRWEQVTIIGLEPRAKKVPLGISIDRT